MKCSKDKNFHLFWH